LDDHIIPIKASAAATSPRYNRSEITVLRAEKVIL